MQPSRTFSIHFWLNIAKRKDDLAPIYARVTVDGKRAEMGHIHFMGIKQKVYVI